MITQNTRLLSIVSFSNSLDPIKKIERKPRMLTKMNVIAIDIYRKNKMHLQSLDK